MNIDLVKFCSKCGETKPLSAFYKNRSKPDGLSSYCKTCNNAETYRQAREKVERNPMHLPIIVIGDQQRCNRCGEFKTFSAFYRNKSTKHGLSNICKECRKEMYSKDDNYAKESLD